jgi:hypothetical protein
VQHVSPFRSTLCTSYLCLTSGGDGGGTLPVLDRAAAATTGLDGLDNLVRLDIAIRNAAEDDVLAVEPRGDDGGDEELGAVAVVILASSQASSGYDVRVGAGVGHRQEEGLLVGQLEVLVAELLAVDGLATSALPCVSVLVRKAAAH